jgi:hypothetical protein
MNSKTHIEIYKTSIKNEREANELLLFLLPYKSVLRFLQLNGYLFHLIKLPGSGENCGQSFSITIASNLVSSGGRAGYKHLFQMGHGMPSEP